MAKASDILNLVSTMKEKGQPFALATVVRTVAATAAKAGARAVILPDGTIVEGWIGGGCARAAVIKAARQALADGRVRLVSIQPADLLDQRGVVPGDELEGIAFATNACPSQGTMDIAASRDRDLRIEPGRRRRRRSRAPARFSGDGLRTGR